ncbi:G-protein coupled receptor family C group 6 member A-like [Astyanax mexicanus]|uniref:G-protein coupled receptor family C group 6 member A-like n=1 Tax=Astyanax mexicanus TaxID=7994 RepID=A0A8T2MFS3_ASTMX|nr:G-protein coupled receptor family C group 6 member A-like [Astyanax mexicanus]
MRSHSCIYVLGVAVILGMLGPSSGTESLCAAYAPGDIIIGILSSVHANIKDLQPWILPDLSVCINFDLITFVQALASIHTIETINDSGFLPGIRLGYLMCDPCSYATKALHCVEHMLAVNRSLTVLSDYSNLRPPVKVFLGERYTETSLPIARLLSLYRIPQISCTSSASVLSDKIRYTSFFRVIPSNKYQALALAKLMSHFNWTWVGVVYLDDDYGKGIFENFLTHIDKEKICLAFDEVVPNYPDMTQDLKKVADLIQSSNATVVLLLLRVQQVETLFKEMITRNSYKIWIASNTWSLARYIMKMEGIHKVGDILGINFITGNIPGFEDYLQNLKPGPGARNYLINEYKQIRFNCSQQSEHTSSSACNVTNPQEANDDYLLQAVDPTEAYNQRVAVYAFAHGLKKLLKCNDTACSGETDFQPLKLLNILRKVNFTLDNQTYSFDEDGNFETGYDIMTWKKNGNGKISEVVGKFLLKTGEVDIKDERIQWSSNNNTVPSSMCTKPCAPGTEKKILSKSCCYNCTNCSEGYYSDKDQTACQKCPNGTWSLPGSSECEDWQISYLVWSSAYCIVVIIGTVIGIVLLVFSFIFFIHHREKFIIKDFFIVSCLMKLGLLVSFGSVIVFLGRPTKHLCMAQQTMYALGFTLCVSCILVKAFNTFIAFIASDPIRQRKLSRLDKPFVIIIFLTLVQALICIFWLVFGPLDALKFPSKTPLTKNLLCTQGSMYGFGAMHVYIALLAVACFLMAFKGRDNETEPIVFSMLIHLFAWLCFIPVFITQDELRPIVQISAIMVSNYGVIFCHFTPKWYKILVEKTEIPKKTKSKNSVDSISIYSISQSRLNFTESEIFNWDNNSMNSEDQSVSVRYRRPNSQRPRSV